MLLIKLVAAVMCCQFTVSVEPVPVFSVSVDAPTTGQSSVVAEPVKQSRRYLAAFTASWCRPCQTWKANVLPQVQAAGHHVMMIDMDAASSRVYKKKIDRVPAFVVCDWETGNWLTEPVFGGIDSATVKRLLVGPSEKPKQVVSAVSTGPKLAPPVSSLYNGRIGSSHRDRSTLISHLLNDSIHAGRRSRATLDAMTDSELDALHNQDHRAVARPSRRRFSLFR